MKQLTFEIKEVGQEVYTKQFNTPFNNIQGIAKFNT
jgi:hypothetical protein